MGISTGVIGISFSKNCVPIRLTQERWLHITTAHPEITSSESAFALTIIESPDVVLKGDRDELRG